MGRTPLSGSSFTNAGFALMRERIYFEKRQNASSDLTSLFGSSHVKTRLLWS
jgi:hypothetical protein